MPAESYAPVHSRVALKSEIDEALLANRRAELFVSVVAFSVMLLGAGVLATAYVVRNIYISLAALALQGLLYWPIPELLRLKRDDVTIRNIATILSTESRQDAVDRLTAQLIDVLRKSSVTAQSLRPLPPPADTSVSEALWPAFRQRSMRRIVVALDVLEIFILDSIVLGISYFVFTVVDSLSHTPPGGFWDTARNISHGFFVLFYLAWLLKDLYEFLFLHRVKS